MVAFLWIDYFLFHTFNGIFQGLVPCMRVTLGGLNALMSKQFFHMVNVNARFQ